MLIKRGTDVKQTINEGSTALHLACEFGHDQTVGALISRGSSVSTVGKEGYTALHWAAQNGHTGVVRMLLAHRSDPNTADHKGCTPLHHAARNGHREIAELLIKKKADVNRTNEERWMPLHFAVANGHCELVTLLLNQGVDSFAADRQKKSAIQLASEKSQHGCIDLMMKHVVGESFDKLLTAIERLFRPENEHDLCMKGVESTNTTALHVAAGYGDLAVVQALVRICDDVMKKANKDGHTPIDIARARFNGSPASAQVSGGDGCIR